MENAPLTIAELLARLDAERRPRPDLATPFEAPGDAVEAELAVIWSKILGLREVGIHDNFFMIGGDSLRLTQVSSRLRSRFNIEVSFAQFFDNPTIAGLAIVLRESLEPKAVSEEVHGLD
jgi:aryl carrier-like protein